MVLFWFYFCWQGSLLLGVCWLFGAVSRITALLKNKNEAGSKPILPFLSSQVPYRPTQLISTAQLLVNFSTPPSPRKSIMVLVPDALMWEMTKKNHCFLYKKNGKKHRVGSIALSKDPGNVKSLHQFQSSGMANGKTINITTDKAHRIQLVTKSTSQAGKTTAWRKCGVNQSFTKAASTLEKTTAGIYYRRDLKNALLAKYSKVYRAARRAKGLSKPIPVKMGRGTLGQSTLTNSDKMDKTE
jgi:large subunit ribosomal protein L28e